MKEMVYDSAHYAIKSLHSLPAKEQLFDPIWIIYVFFICVGLSFPLISAHFTHKENKERYHRRKLHETLEED